MTDQTPTPSVEAEHETLHEETDTYEVAFLVPAALQIMDNFEAMVHDEALAHAHVKNYLPVGPIFIAVEPGPDKPPPPSNIPEGLRMTGLDLVGTGKGVDPKAFMEGFLGSAAAPAPTPQVRVTASMQIAMRL